MRSTSPDRAMAPAQARGIVLGPLRAMPGYLPGMRQPTLLAECAAPPPAAPEALLAFRSRVEALTGPLPELPAAGFERYPAIATLVRALLGLMRVAGWPLLSPPQLLSPSPTPSRLWIAVPALHDAEGELGMALQTLAAALNACQEDSCDPAGDLEEILGRLRLYAPGGINTARFIEAAHVQGIPWKRVSGNVFQFGWGARARWLDSSFTEFTPRISTMLCRDKRRTASVLRRAGVPVPQHASAATEADALRIAGQLGYPVVVKPADLDGGRGVKTHLDTPAAVARAFAAARMLSKHVLVEKQVDGNDYRLQVFRGEVYWATHRVPASVTGDGTSTVRALIAAANAEPKRNTIGGLKHITLDDEAHEWLARQGLDLDAVPAAGRRVRLKGAANVASGGIIVPVLESAHPDNLALAARAARLLRLDVAGVDLLVPDIGRSWLETGGAICEVNAQPQMAKHLPALLLPRIVQRQGRIPVVLIIGGAADSADCTALLAGLRNAVPGTGFGCSAGAWVDERQVARGPLPAFRAGLCLLDDPAVTLAILHIGDADMLRSGWCVDAADHLVLAGPLAGADSWNATLMLAARLARIAKHTWLLDSTPQWTRLQTLSATPATVSTLLQHIVGSIAAGNAA